MIRIYFQKISNQHINDVMSQCSVIQQEIYYCIFSPEGIFKLNPETNILHKMICKDSDIEYSNICGFDVVIDKSEVKFSNISYQIPFYHVSKKLSSETYLLREKSDLKFVLLKDLDDKNKILDFYFIFDGCMENVLFKEDMLTFLSKIK
jgi:hypothetical protein